MSTIDTSLTLVVPVYNEERRIGECAPLLIHYIDEWAPSSRLLFVDDGSEDATPEKLKVIIEESVSDKAEIVRRPHEGKGSAVRFGLRQSKTDVAAFCDLDLATPLDELSRLIELSRLREALVVGSRAQFDSHILRHEARAREIAGRVFNKLVQILLCPGIKDTQCGAKAAPTWIWQMILQVSIENGFAWDVEVIAEALLASLEVVETGVRWSHDGRSRVNVGHDGIAMVLAVMKLKSRLMGRSIARKVNAVT